MLTNRDKFLLYAEMTKMVKAGFGFDRASELLLRQAGSPAQRRFAEGLQKGLRRGESLADAMDQMPLGITNLETSIVRAAEASGNLEEGFAYLHGYFHTLWKTNRQVVVRLVYPFVLLHLAVFLPALPKLIMDPSLGVLQEVGIRLGVLYAGVAVLGLAAVLLNRRAAVDRVADGLLSVLPLLGRARQLIAWQRFCSVLGMYVRSGQKISTGLDAAALASQSARIHQAGSRLAEVARSGSPDGDVMQRQRAFPEDFARSISMAETAVTLD